ncbi:hypothetical protein [Dongia sp.]|uniref:hypothetical protein n=1 Tax=Dongia sp. TaxID=1977262 RepID=UPI0035B034F1
MTLREMAAQKYYSKINTIKRKFETNPGLHQDGGLARKRPLGEQPSSLFQANAISRYGFGARAPMQAAS